MLKPFSIACLMAMLTSRAIGQTTMPDPNTNAADLYARAATLVTVNCPAASDLIYPQYPPYPDEWMRIEKAAFETNRPARELAHQAYFLNRADWPNNTNTRKLVYDLADAALWEHIHDDHAAAVQSLLDIFHLADLLKLNAGASSSRQLVATGLEAIAASRLMVIACGAKLTADPNDSRSLQISDARALIDQLLNMQHDPREAPLTVSAESQARFVETVNRVNADLSFCAMSLACQIFRFEKSRWPIGLEELVPAYLPRAPIDPWGDGKQTLGYVLIKGGLPDRSDRPLVYSRCMSNDGLAYRIDQPHYEFYSFLSNDKQTGQFRDVARWSANVPVQQNPAPTKPLP